MTFFGVCVKVGEKTSLSGSSEAELLHLSSIVLKKIPAKTERLLLHIADGLGTEYVAAALDAESSSRNLDLYVPSGTTVRLSASGSSSAEAHITGYSEPMSFSEDEEDSDLSDGDQEIDAGGVSMQNLSQQLRDTLAGLNHKVTSTIKPDNSRSASDDDGDENDEEDSESDLEGSSSDDESADASEQENISTAVGALSDNSSESETDPRGNTEDERKKIEQPSLAKGKGTISDDKSATLSSKSKESVSPQLSEKKGGKKDISKKRKPFAQPEGAPASKKSANSAEKTFETSIVAFVKAQGGSCKISALGARVKKPVDLKATKLGQFMRERSSIFSIQGDSVTLKQ